MSLKVKKSKEMKCAVQTRMLEYTKKGHDVIPTRSVKLWTHIAHKVKPPVVDIWVTGPDDMGRCKDIHINLKSLVAELKRVKVI